MALSRSRIRFFRSSPSSRSNSSIEHLDDLYPSWFGVSSTFWDKRIFEDSKNKNFEIDSSLEFRVVNLNWTWTRFRNFSSSLCKSLIIYSDLNDLVLTEEHYPCSKSSVLNRHSFSCSTNSNIISWLNYPEFELSPKWTALEVKSGRSFDSTLANFSLSFQKRSSKAFGMSCLPPFGPSTFAYLSISVQMTIQFNLPGPSTLSKASDSSPNMKNR